MGNEKGTNGQEDTGCRHTWQYERSEGVKKYFRCMRCGKVRKQYPWELSAIVAGELNIRHDGKDGDV